MSDSFNLVLQSQQRGWRPDDPLALEIIARLIDKEQPVTIVQQAGKPLTGLPEHIPLQQTIPSDPDPTLPLVIISDRLLGPRPDVDRLVVLRPPTLSLGIASRRELSIEDLTEAVRLFCRRTGFSSQSVMAVGASSRRRQLSALDEYADQLKVPLLLYDDHILKKSPLPMPGKMAGTCEVSAILAAGVTSPEVGSTPFFGKLSLALAKRKD